jgi:CrcB protein
MQLLRELAAIAAGGALGAASRYLVTQGMQRLLGTGFPWGTLTVNVVGSLAFGAFYAVLAQRSGGLWRAAIMVGFLGALTTFSTFSMDTLNLLQQGQLLRAGTNVVANVLICLTAAWLGLVVCRYLMSTG